jgi:DNA-binding transcriptional LysR family regulator
LNEPFLAREEGSGTEHSVLEYLHRAELPADTLHIAARMDDPESIKTMVAQGAGVSILSELAVRKELADGRLLAFEVDKDSLRRTIYMVCRRNVRYTGQERQFLEFIRRTGKDLTAE